MTTDQEARARIRGFFAPITIILICIPLVLNLIPRNGLYGVRTRETMASDAAWYAGNRIGGIALIAASAIWLVAARYAPRRYVAAIGVATVLVAVALLFVVQRWSL
jgi:uncharacterized membrane protein